MANSSIMNRQESKSKLMSNEGEFRAKIVQLIVVRKDPERAVEELSARYRVQKPAIKMGLPKGEKRALGCYVRRDRTIYLADAESLYDPYVIIHEFYHHLRSVSGKHRGTERHAREFALSFLKSTTGEPSAKQKER